MPRKVRFEGKVHAFPDDATDEEIASTLGQKSSAPISGKTPEKGLFRRGAEVVRKGLAVPLDILAGPPLPLEQGPTVGETVARFITPETPTELGIMAGTLAAGPAGAALRLGTKLGPAVGRVVGATAGGAAGGAIEDPSVSGAAIGGAKGLGAGALGEGVSGFVSKVGRSLPGAKGYIANRYREAVGETIRTIIPDFGAPNTPQDFVRLAKLARNQGGALGQIIDKAETQIVDLVSRPGMKIHPRLTLGNYPGASPTSPASVRFDEAVKELRNLYRKGFGEESAKRTEAAQEAREQAIRLRAEIQTRLNEIGRQQGLGTRLGDIWDSAQQRYSQGLEIVKEVGKAMKPGPDGPYLDEAALQAAVFQRFGRASEVFRRSPEALEAWLDTVLRGGEVGAKSQIVGGSGRIVGSMLEPWRMIGAQKGGMGAVAGAIPRTILPNVSSRYAGRPPGLPEGVRTAADLLAARGITRATDAE